jgi:sugar phosphate isomerase/epimerase
MNRRHFLASAGAAVAAAAAPLQQAPAGKARFRSGLVAYSYRQALGSKKMSYDDLVRVAVDSGIDGLDLTVYWFPNTSDDFLLPLKRLAYKSGVEIYSISVRTELTRATQELRDKEVAGLHNWIDVAEKLGANHIRIFGGAVPKGSTDDQAAAWVVECLKRASEHAARKGVILGLENHGGITERAARIIDIVKRVDSPWVAINLDTGNFRREVFPQIEMCLPQAVNTQVKVEMSRDDGTSGPSDWDRIFQMFVRHNYRGYMALEYEAKEDAAIAVPRELRRLDQLCRKYTAA